MISNITLSNIRIFSDKDWKFPLFPLTVFCGTNSSGKSSIIKSLLLIKQTESFYENIFQNRGKLKFIGPQVDLGNFKSLVSYEDIERKIVIGISIKDVFPNHLWQKVINYSRGSLEKTEENEVLGNEGKVIDYSLDTKFTFIAGNPVNDNRLEFKPNRIEKKEEISQGILESAEFVVSSVNGDKIISWSVIKKADDYYFRIAREFFINAYKDVFPDFLNEYNDLFFQTDEKNNTKENEVVEFKTTLIGILPNKVIFEKRNEKNESDRTSFKQKIEFPIHPAINSFQNDFEFALENICYLGPLRSPAQRFYLTPLDVTPPMDPTGEFLPYIFREISRGNTFFVDYIPPKETEEKRKIKLEKALNDWLYYIRTGSKAEENSDLGEIVFNRTKVLLEYGIKGTEKGGVHAIADSGFGYSQVLPILIRCLMAHRNSTIIIEQPELHLNPALQTRLTEFFISMIALKKQLIIETHSEHIVNMIRVLTAEHLSGELSTKSIIYFLENNEKGVTITDLSIDKNGMVPQWPISFFGESARLTGRLLRAQRNIKPTS